jgi:branched-subunit amino acid transport protein
MTGTEPAGASWLLLAGAIAVTFAWRALGVALSSRVNTESTLFQWITCVTYALLAGVVVRMIVLPLGDLATTPLPHRLLAIAAGLAIFFLTRRNVIAGVLGGVGLFILLTAA